MFNLKHFFVVMIVLLLTSCQGHLTNPVVKQSDNGAIIGGSPTQAGEFSFAVNIWANDPSENYVAHLCGGSLIASKWVLTAAHCVFEDTSETERRIVSPSKLLIYIGGIQLSGQDGRSVKIESIQVHPDFNWPNTDIALIELSEEVTDITPIALNDVDLSESNETVTVVGWGLTENDGKTDSPFLKKLSAPLLPIALCSQDEFPRAHGYNLGSETLCIQTYQHQQASCPGDSGGPLFLKRNNQYTQVGVVSWGSACSGARSKGSSAVGYASVSHALPWIQKMTAKNHAPTLK
ncbi:MAG: S1 family peptidase [Bacillota bacterium]